MEEEIKRWNDKIMTALVLEIIQAKTTVAEARRSFVIALTEIEEGGGDDTKRGMENVMHTKP